MKRAPALFLWVLAFLAPAMARGRQEDPKDLVKFDLLASTPAPEPGKPFTLAIHAKIKNPWHIYWLNPGDSGMATAFKLKLPDGWKAGEVQYPIPHKFDQPGGFVGYGYVDEATFLVDITPPPDAKPGAKLSVEVVYLVCDKICLPGRQSCEIELRDGKWPTAEPRQVEAWKSKVPAGSYGPSGGSDEPQGYKISGSLTSSWSAFVVHADNATFAGSSVPEAVFPLLGDDVEIRNIRLADNAEVSFEAKYLGDPERMPKSLRFLVTFKSMKPAALWLSVPTK